VRNKMLVMWLWLINASAFLCWTRHSKWHRSIEVNVQFQSESNVLHPHTHDINILISIYVVGGCSGVVVEYRTPNREVAGSTHTRSSASNLQQVANLLCAQANSASYPQWDGKWVVATAMGWRPSVADWGDGVSTSYTMCPVVR